MARRSIYIPDEIDMNIIGVKPGSPESYSGRITYLASLGNRAAMDAAPELAVDEWCAIADALNGHWPSYEMGMETVIRSALFSVAESAPELDEKWGVDCADLALRIRQLPLLAQAGVIEIARAFWSRGDEVQEAESYDDFFRRLGARVKQDVKQ